MTKRASSPIVVPPSEILSPHDIRLAEHAAVIRSLGKRIVADIIEIGRRLTECKTAVGHGNWLPWLKREFGWQEITALNFVRVYQMSLKSSKFEDLNVPVSGLYLLAAPSTPDEAREVAIDKATKSKKGLTLAEVKKLIAQAKQEQSATTADKLKRADEAATEKLQKLKDQYDKKVSDLQDELEGSMTPKNVRAAIREAVKPLKDKIVRYEQKLKNKAQRVQIENAVPSSSIRGALRYLASVLTITPEQVVQSQTQLATVTQQSPSDILADDLANSKTVISWLQPFIKQVENLK